MAKQIKTLADAQAVINDLYNRLELQRTKDWDFTGLRIKNASDGVDPTDYVTLRQLQPSTTPDVTDNDYYTIVFDKDGAVTDGENSPEFVIGAGREGQPTEIWVKCKAGFEPSGGDLIINVSWTYYNNIGDPVTANLLTHDLHLPEGTSKPASSSAFLNPVPTLARGAIIDKIIVSANNASYVAIGVVVKVLNKVRA